MSAIEVKGLVKRFPSSNVPAVDDFTLTFDAGTFVCMLGASGSGKTTVLRMIAGLETPDNGEITIDDGPVFSSSRRIDIPPHKRPTSMVFQSYALWPHMSVFQNIAYPLRRARIPKREIRERVSEVLELLKCDALARRYPSELSGGQQQRIALGRAIVNPTTTVILFDEPLSNLDAKLRDELRHDLRQLQEELRFTAIYVTHDQAEAMSMSDQVVVMRDGRIERVDGPARVFHHPGTAFVAKFFGAQNVISGTVTCFDESEAILATDVGEIRASTSVLDKPPAVGQEASVAIPAGAVQVRTTSEGGPGVPATVQAVSYYGDFSDLVITVGAATQLRCRYAGREQFSRGTRVVASVSGDFSCLAAGTQRSEGR